MVPNAYLGELGSVYARFRISRHEPRSTISSGRILLIMHIIITLLDCLAYVHIKGPLSSACEALTCEKVLVKTRGL